MGDGNLYVLCYCPPVIRLGSAAPIVAVNITGSHTENAKHYKPLWIGKDTFSIHVKQVQLAGVWGTQVAL